MRFVSLDKVCDWHMGGLLTSNTCCWFRLICIVKEVFMELCDGPRRTLDHAMESLFFKWEPGGE